MKSYEISKSPYIIIVLIDKSLYHNFQGWLGPSRASLSVKLTFPGSFWLELFLDRFPVWWAFYRNFLIVAFFLDRSPVCEVSRQEWPLCHLANRVTPLTSKKVSLTTILIWLPHKDQKKEISQDICAFLKKTFLRPSFTVWDWNVFPLNGSLLHFFEISPRCSWR